MTKAKKQGGFTIIELLIATTVFSVILVVITGAVVQIGRLYYKGLTMSRTQEVARNVLEDISRSIQYTSGTVQTSLPKNGNTFGKCIGLRQYSYLKNVQVNRSAGAGNSRGLVVNDVTGSCNTAQNLQPGPGDPVVEGNEMLAEKMRVTKLNIDPNGTKVGSWKVDVRIIYGDDEVLCLVPPAVGSNGATCDNGIPLPAGELSGADNLQCKNIRSGSEFCAVSELSTIVERRLE